MQPWDPRVRRWKGVYNRQAAASAAPSHSQHLGNELSRGPRVKARTWPALSAHRIHAKTAPPLRGGREQPAPLFSGEGSSAPAPATCCGSTWPQVNLPQRTSLAPAWFSPHHHHPGSKTSCTCPRELPLLDSPSGPCTRPSAPQHVQSSLVIYKQALLRLVFNMCGLVFRQDFSLIKRLGNVCTNVDALNH